MIDLLALYPFHKDEMLLGEEVSPSLSPYPGGCDPKSWEFSPLGRLRAEEEERLRCGEEEKKINQTSSREKNKNKDENEKEKEREKEKKMRVTANTIPTSPPKPDGVLFRLICIKILARRCDGAKNLDGAGFNKFDAPLGHFLAELPADRWTWSSVYSAEKLIRKYQKQIKSAGVRLEDMNPC